MGILGTVNSGICFAAAAMGETKEPTLSGESVGPFNGITIEGEVLPLDSKHSQSLIAGRDPLSISKHSIAINGPGDIGDLPPVG